MIRGWLKKKAIEKRWRREAEAQYRAEVLPCHHGVAGARLVYTGCAQCINEVEVGTYPND